MFSFCFLVVAWLIVALWHFLDEIINRGKFDFKMFLAVLLCIIAIFLKSANL